MFQNLGTFLRIKREQAGLTQMQVTSALGYSSPQFCSNWERGMCYPSLETIPHLARLLGIKQAELTERVLNALVAVAVYDMGLVGKVKVSVKVA